MAKNIFILTWLVMGLLFSSTAEADEFFTDDKEIDRVLKSKLKGYRNFSGITFVERTGHYWIVNDRPCYLVEISAGEDEIEFHRSVRLHGFHDCEAVVSLGPGEKPGSDRFVVAEERRGNIVEFTVEPEVFKVYYGTDTEIYPIISSSSMWKGNSGIEALAVDLTRKGKPIYYVGKEEKPRKIYKTQLRGRGEVKISIPWDAEEVMPKKSDLADFFIFKKDLFILDERMDRIRQVSLNKGDIISEYVLPRSGFKKYEGIAMIEKSDRVIEMVIVAEPNLIYVYEIK